MVRKLIIEILDSSVFDELKQLEVAGKIKIISEPDESSPKFTAETENEDDGKLD